MIVVIFGGDKKSPLFIVCKMFRKKVEALVSEALDKDKSLFLIDVSVSKDNKINVVIDSDKGVTLNDCITINRYIEHHLDREEADFSIEVSSPGVSEPIKNKRQFKKNIGRNLKLILTNGEKIDGILKDADDEKWVLEWKIKEPKPVGKGKKTVIKKVEKGYSEIKEAKVIIKFNKEI
jgi:ribosome maturation factor RimP